MTRYNLFLIVFFFSCHIAAKSIYVAPNGSDSNPGTIDLPYFTLTKAMSSVVAGDSIIMRGGRYVYTTTVKISKNGTESSRIVLTAFPKEHVTLDFSGMAVGSSNRGINMQASYWYIYRIDVKGAGDNGMYVTGSHNTIEFCAFYQNQDSGCQLSGGASYNRVINCDAYFNKDPGQGNADGFSPKLDVGTGNYFYGCRSWQNSDDGWDGYLRPSDNVTDTLENCWCFANGYLMDGTAGIGNGNGFKLGGSDTKTLAHNFVLIHCIAFDNRVKGFDQNNNVGSMTLINCTGYRNGTNYSINSSILYTGHTLTVINCTVSGAKGTLTPNTELTCNWQTSAADFLSLDTAGVRGPRKADGSLPDIPFLRPNPAGSLIDRGTNIGLPYFGTAPDIGAFEYNPNNSVNERDAGKADDFRLEQNYPNPFNPSTDISFYVPRRSNIIISVYNTLGQKIAALTEKTYEPGFQRISFKAVSLPSGPYYCVMNAGGNTYARKMLLVK